MSRVDDAEKLLAEMSSAEKEELLERIVRDLDDGFPGIEETPGVCDGAPRIVRTGIPVWLLEQARRSGTSEADLLKAHPDLRLEDLANAWAFERSHRELIDSQIRLNEAD